MPLTVYISRRLDHLGHDIGQITAHAHSTCLGKYRVGGFKAL